MPLNPCAGCESVKSLNISDMAYGLLLKDIHWERALWLLNIAKENGLDPKTGQVTFREQTVSHKQGGIMRNAAK